MDDVEHNNKQMLTPQSRPAADMAEKTRMQLSMYSLVAAVCSFVGMIMVFALVIVFANTNFDGDTKVHLWGTPAAPAPAPAPAPVHLMCASDQPVPASGLDGVALAYNNMGKDMLNGQAARRYEGMAAQLKPIGWHQGLLAEASDAGDRSELIADGMSGDVDFPHGNFQTILTIGEYDAKTGYIPVGVPDGQGVYLKDKDTVRLIFQSESYGHLSGNPSWYLPVNGGSANFTGSHITFVDYDKEKFKAAVNAGSAIAPTVKEAGELFDTVFNLMGNKVDGTSANPHYGDTGMNGEFVTDGARYANEWTFHSFCSAHLEEKHQWGPNLGLEDTTFMTVEEWTNLDAAKVTANGFVGLSAHAVNIATKELHAVGAFGMGGYEKIVEINCGVEGYVCFSLSGYNGNFGGDAQKIANVARKQAVSPKRTDGTDWVYPQDVVPARVYVGVKGYNANGTACGAGCGYLAKNGLAHGRVYGFAVPAAMDDRDAWHKPNDRSITPELVPGVFAPTAWKWDGAVKNFEHDQAWDFQEPPTAGPTGYKFWNARGRDASGSKTEHNTPDPRGNARFMQGSTAGYMGIYDLSAPNSLRAVLTALPDDGSLPLFIPAAYELIEGETDVSDRIELGGKGVRSDGGDQTHMHDKDANKNTFEDIDGLEWFAASDGDYIMIQEDGGNLYGERTLMYKMPAYGVKPTYYFLAMAGGKLNTRMLAGVSIPANTFTSATANEFSGMSDFSGAFIQTTLGGAARRAAEATVAINDKFFAVGLQAHTIAGGVVAAFGADRGGQIYAFKPALPAM